MKRLICLILAVAIGWLLFYDGIGFIEKCRFSRFNKEAWMHAKADERFIMSKYLIDQRVLLHLSKAKVLDMLGTPDIFQERFFIYNLGHRRFGMDTNPRLVITFDAEYTVSEYNIDSST